MKGGGKKQKDACFVVTNGGADDGLEEGVSPNESINNN
jgi:hypothetical protein